MPIKSVDAKTLKKWIDHDDVVLIDVREPSEHATHNIKCAKLVPLAHVELKNIPETGSKKLVLHCQAGRRSMMACQKLIKEKPDLELYNLEGGINAWASICG